MVTRAHLSGQDASVGRADGSTGTDTSSEAVSDDAAGRLTTAGAAYTAARAALDAALPPGWRSAAVESLPAERALLVDDRTTAA